MTEIAGVIDATPLVSVATTFPSFYATRWPSLAALAGAITRDRVAGGCCAIRFRGRCG